MLTWETLEASCGDCRQCVLSTTRTHVVFGMGRRNAEVLFVGEGPGEQEDKQGLPFVGRAGELLTDMLTMIGLDRDRDVYITNVVKCRPPENRDPLHTEEDACLPWLRRQYKLIRPKIVVCLGRIAAAALIDPDFKITRDHGRWFEKDGVFFMAMYHPAALLRDDSKRPDTFVDLKTLQAKIREVCPATPLLTHDDC